MRQRLSLLIAIAAASASAPAAAQQAQGAAGTQIVEPAGIAIIQDVVAKVSASIVVFGSTGQAVSMAVPGSVNLSSASGQSLTLGTESTMSLESGFLSQNAVSVSIGAVVDGQSGASPAGNYGGLMVVLAQYN